MRNDSPWVPVAEIARPHGIRGELRLKLYNADSSALSSAREVLVRNARGEERMMRIESARATSGALLVQFRGVLDRTQAESLRDHQICVQRSEFPPLDEGEFYACDVEGASVRHDQRVVGQVEELLSYPAADALRIRTTDGRTVELPLVDPFIERVDTAGASVWVTAEALELLS